MVCRFDVWRGLAGFGKAAVCSILNSRFLTPKRKSYLCLRLLLGGSKSAAPQNTIDCHTPLLKKHMYIYIYIFILYLYLYLYLYVCR